MRKNMILILLVLSSLQVIGQKKIVITGNIIDKKTKEPLPFAAIVYQNKSIGTISNVDGFFTLSLLNVSESDSIFISYVGYEPIKTIISNCIEAKTYKLEPIINELSEVVVTSKKFKLKSFIKEVIADYNKNRRESSHVAIAHYCEKAKEDNKYIMYMESIGYSVYAGNQADATPLSNYKFFYENTKCHVVNPQWVSYKANNKGYNVQNVRPSGGSNLNLFRYFELYGLLSNKYSDKYNYKIDSTYSIGNNAVYCIDFIGDIAKGKMYVFADSKQLLKIECTTNKYWSTAFHKRVDAQVSIQFIYFENTPFISSILTNYKNGRLEHQNYLEVLFQKFNDFELSKEEYWSLNSYDANPYIEYIPNVWAASNIKIESDYNIIKNDLKLPATTLEKQFENYSGRWFFTNEKGNEIAKSKISQLKQNF